MSRKSEFLRKNERMEITLPTLLEYYTTSKKVAGCSPKTLIAIRSVLGRFIRFLQSRDHGSSQNSGVSQRVTHVQRGLAGESSQSCDNQRHGQ